MHNHLDQIQGSSAHNLRLHIKTTERSCELVKLEHILNLLNSGNFAQLENKVQCVLVIMK